MIRIGIPYANQIDRDGKVFAVCPVCKDEIELTGRKDFESPSIEAYQRHYRGVHEPIDIIANRLQAVAETQRGVVPTSFAVQQVLLSMQTAGEIVSWHPSADDPPMLSYRVVLPNHEPHFFRVRARPI
jgi:hypothetical protein